MRRIELTPREGRRLVPADRGTPSSETEASARDSDPPDGSPGR